ncbi:MAG TPA: hypothetical protein P5555_19490 [Candidatus Paceibacterota bacterium]|nr:hypothetical protein [Candidatus Paceibacterota bacterium]
MQNRAGRLLRGEAGDVARRMATGMFALWPDVGDVRCRVDETAFES